MRAYSLVEATISVVIVGVMLVAAVNTVGASRLSQQKMSDRNLGISLAQDLMSEILRQQYAPPGYGDTFGRSPTEPAGGPRALWDDVDDYDGWSASPPQEKDGTEMPNLDAWKRSVVVNWVDPDNTENVVGSNRGVKRIAVTVTRDKRVVASLVALKTDVWPYQ